jgi:predicted O-methyltransferase YrrM
LRIFIRRLLPLLDWFISPLTLLSAALLWTIRRAGIEKMRVSRYLFRKIGVFPIRDHYYEPLFNPKYLTKPLSDIRSFPWLDLNIREQLSILGNFQYVDELIRLPLNKSSESEFYYHNESFGPGDAEYLYSVIRFYKPKRIVEIGCGNSTLVVLKALEQNKKENAMYRCAHTCIEPYEAPWLEGAGIHVIRNRVEHVDKQLFAELEAHDVLFIDSSHVIKPQGDVLYECLEVLPLLNTGVLVHFHDIYTPRDYPDTCLIDNVRFWNEQYLLEAILSANSKFRIIGALNYLKHNYYAELSSAMPVLKNEPFREPASFWIMKNYDE